ncbi:hypothetical protein Fcan01_18065 [Folsomia candida]|uniref:Uncharacterized protein n=1 Tax=Folsomia candida TaxID=158441 RepID=A0A226DQG3_FOLCA|nr:hypothetical protein Fcan01_18065 [Folsomia candida]
MAISNSIFFKNKKFPYLEKSKILSVADFLSLNQSQFVENVHVSSRRHLSSEIHSLQETLKSLEMSPDLPLTLQCYSFGSKTDFEMVTKATAYLLCIPVSNNISWGLIGDYFNFKCWGFLKKSEIPNPEKDIVYKLWHNRGLTPSLAVSLGIYGDRNCPYCSWGDISANHYLICQHFTPLWRLIYKILKLKFDVRSLASLQSGSGDRTRDILVFYGICTSYKAAVHVLNGFSGDFDPVQKYKHVIFGRILTEYHVALRSGKLAVEEFHKKWAKFNNVVKKMGEAKCLDPTHIGIMSQISGLGGSFLSISQASWSVRLGSVDIPPAPGVPNPIYLTWCRGDVNNLGVRLG